MPLLKTENGLIGYWIPSEKIFLSPGLSAVNTQRGLSFDGEEAVLQTELVSGTTTRVNTAVGNPEYEKNRYPFVWFSNTSSCIRKEVWEKYPFRKVEFAEDQDWAQRVLEAGYKLSTYRISVVLHSHNYRPVKNFRRHFEHAKAMKEIFRKRRIPPIQTYLHCDPGFGQSRFSIFSDRKGDTPGGF